MDLDVHAGELVGLIGPNGAGKTTFFNAVSGFLHIDAGQIRFRGEPIQRLPVHARVARGLVRTFQITRSLGGMTVLDNLLVAAPAQPGERLLHALAAPRRVRARERAIRDEAEQMLRTFNLGHVADAYAAHLSGGQKKLLELARALMTRPRMLLLDEPMAGVNPTLARELMDDIHRARREYGVTILLVEHDMETVFNHCERIVVMAQGRKLAEGDARAIRSNAAVIEAYLGEAPTDVSEATP